MEAPIRLATQPLLSPAQRQALQTVASMIIPADRARGLPGADDPLIAAAIEDSLGRDAPAVIQALQRLDDLAHGEFASRPVAVREQLAASLRDHHPALAAVLEAVTVQAYYRDDRVMKAIGMDVRAPYPKGFDLEPGDLSLLDPVRARPPIWRTVP